MVKPQEGEVFKIIMLGGKSFEIKYGYYEDYERNAGDPIPIYPDFIKEPCYANDGRPFVTQMQDTCKTASDRHLDGFCVECKHFCYGEDLIGFCNFGKNKHK